jgi:nucleotide-binding universal stress UspA family protein
MTPFKHILVPTDFSTTGQSAVEMAVMLAKQFGATLTLLHVTEIPTYAYSGVYAAPRHLLNPVLEAAELELAQALAQVRTQLPDASSILRPGYPADEIVAAVLETKSDLLVIGTHGRRGVSHLLLGSVAEKIVRTSPVPVLTVHCKA